jgi:formate hydrogenlyase transcriptional activator
VRIIAATNRDLRQAAAEGAFREDLYYRLNVFPIHMPPLRERGDDIVLLASTFAERFARRLGRPVPALGADAARRLAAYAWPGNVRELQNVIERAVITAHGGRLDLDRALPEAGVSGARTPGRPAAESPTAATVREPGGPKPIRTADEMLELERENLRAALDASDWRVSGEAGAARRLGMAPSTLTSRMKALGLVRPRNVS